MRFRHALIASALFICTTSTSANAQSVGNMLVDDVKHAAGDVWSIWTSPFDATGKDWLLAAAVLGAGAAISPWDDDIDRWAVRDSASGLFNALDPVRRGGALYGGSNLVPVAGAVLLAGYIMKNQGMRDGIYGCAASYLSNSQLRRQVIYRFINRRRPNPDKNSNTEPPASQGDQYDFELSAGDTAWGMNSFPGGHVANIAACATFLNHRFEMGFVEPILYGFAAAVGIGRIADRGHWASDQLVGIAFAYAIGREVALRQKKRIERRKEDATLNPSAIPTSRGSGFYLISDPMRGLGLGWQRTF